MLTHGHRPIKLITCRALAHLLNPLLPPGIERVTLDISLHLRPEKLRRAVNQEIKKIEALGSNIILGYGLCGRGLEGTVSQKSRLILPRVDDCVGAVLGSRARYKKIMVEHPGSFFLEPGWVHTELNIFTECLKGLERIPEDEREDILKLALGHYSTLAFIHHGKTGNWSSVAECQALARSHDLKFVRIPSDLTLLQHLVSGIWTPEEFVIAEPGCEIPYF